MLYIVDPTKGKYKLPASEFQNIWTNIVVLTEKWTPFLNKMNHHLTIKYLQIFLKELWKTNFNCFYFFIY